MTAAARGDEAAFRELVERWERRVLAFLYRSLGSREDAADLAQETFLRLYQAAPGYAPRGRFAPFLFRIAGNLARNEIRRRAVRRIFSRGGREVDPDEVVAQAEAPVGHRPDVAWIRGRDAERVRRALLDLPERQRIAVTLKRFEGFTQEEIAESMGISVSAVESLLVRGMAALRRSLAGR